MRVSVNNSQKDLRIHPLQVRELVKSVLLFEEIETDEVIVHFVTREKISELHALYFDDPSPTDCISFPIDGLQKSIHHHVLGEIFISPKAAIEYVGSKEDDAYLELTLYLVHGLLHLIGFDDLEKKKRAQMRKAERDHLKRLVLEKKILSI